MPSVMNSALPSQAEVSGGDVNRSVQRICTQSGVSLIKDRLITLRDLEQGMKKAVQEAEIAEKDEEFWGKALIAAKFTKAICDVTVDVLLEWAPSPLGKITKKVYDQKDILADASVGKIDAYNVAHSAVKLASDRLAETGKMSKNAETAIKDIGKRADLVKDALTGKLDGRKIGKYIADRHLDIAEKVLKETNGEKAGKVVRSAKAILHFGYELYGIVEEQKENSRYGSGVSAAKKAAIGVLRKIQMKIKDLESEIESCEVPEIQIRMG